MIALLDDGQMDLVGGGPTHESVLSDTLTWLEAPRGFSLDLFMELRPWFSGTRCLGLQSQVFFTAGKG